MHLRFSGVIILAAKGCGVKNEDRRPRPTAFNLEFYCFYTVYSEAVISDPYTMFKPFKNVFRVDLSKHTF